MHVAVAIVGFRNVQDISRCLAALARSTYADFEIVICENGGRPAFDALARAVPQTLAGGQPVRMVEAPRNLGYAGGVNAAMAAAPDADLWWVLNPDTEAQPQTMAALVARMAVGDCDAAGGTLLRPDGTVQSWGGHWRGWLARAVSIGFGRSMADPPSAAAIEARQNYLSGASMMIGRRFLGAVGPMREDYFLYCEEVEWCLRARRLGMRLGFAPEARVLHAGGATTGSGAGAREQPRLPVYLGERNKMLLTRDCFPARLPVAAVAALALLVARYGRERAWRQIGYGLGGWWAGLHNERGASGYS